MITQQSVDTAGQGAGAHDGGGEHQGGRGAHGDQQAEEQANWLKYHPVTPWSRGSRLKYIFFSLNLLEKEMTISKFPPQFSNFSPAFNYWKKEARLISSDVYQ